MRKPTLLTVLAAGILAVAAPAANAAAPTDPQAGGQQPLQIMRVGEALDIAGRPLQDIPVSTLDNGLDVDHPDIQPRLYVNPISGASPTDDPVRPSEIIDAGQLAQWDMLGTAAPSTIKPRRDANHMTANDHGTLVAGVLGAAWNNGQGGAGVAPNARLFALRTCWDDDQCYQSIQAPAIDWMAQRGLRVASFSWLSGTSADLEDGLRTSMTNATNTLFVTIPSGNGGDGDVSGADPMPCGLELPNVLCVSTSSPTDGTDCGGWSATKVDVAVPTQNSVTTRNGGTFTATACATSYAAPTAAGVATILFGLDPTAAPADVKAAIVDSARKVSAWSGKSVSGGIVDAAAAVKLFSDRRGIPTNGGTPNPDPNPTPAKDKTKPKVSLGSIKKGKFTVSLSEKSKVTFTTQRRAIRRKGKKRIAYYKTVGSTAKNLKAGRTSVSVPIGKKAPKGSYRLVVQAKDAAGNKSSSRTLAFSVK